MKSPRPLAYERKYFAAGIWTLLVIAFLCSTAGAAEPDVFTKLEKQKSPRITPVVRAVHTVGPAVVNITTARIVERSVNPFGNRFHDPFFNEFFGTQKRRVKQRSLGSGVIIDGKEGLVLTNAHVIEGATVINTLLMDGRRFEAELVGADTDFDLAVLRLKNAESLPEAPMADSSDILPGETVIAIGNPLGFGHTVTTGVVSALNRSIKTERGVFTDFIQTDTAINPGNSGGPLLNINGELVGINTAVIAKAAGIGFAIPINKARRAVEELLHQGSVSPIWLGLSGQNIDERMGAWLGLKSMRGMVVTEVHENTPSARAGIQVGDAVVAVNRIRVQDTSHYQQLLRNYTTGQRLMLSVVREGKVGEFSLKAATLEATTAEKLLVKRWGFVLAPGRGAMLVKNVRKDSPAGALGLRPGDSITKIGGIELVDTKALTSAFIRHRQDATVLMLVKRQGRGYHVRMKVQ